MDKIQELTFITGNENKAKYIADYFHIPVRHKKLDLPEIQSLSPREIVEDKARRAFREIGTPVLVEDVSLVFNALGGLPGPFIKWFESSLGYDGMCRLLNGYEDRSAAATVTYGLCDGKGVHIFEGRMNGHISLAPKGEETFGWDVIFIHEGEEKTRSELSREEWSKKSMRTEALQKLGEFLK